MMKLISKYNLLIFLVVLLFTGCYEPIDVEFPENMQPVIVIEAVLTDIDEPKTVLVSKTVNMNDSVSSIPVDSALVIISDNMGQFEILNQTAPGRYVSDKIKGITGRQYSLTVETENKHFSASETMYPCNIVDSVYFEYIDNIVIYSEGYYIKAKLNFEDDSPQFFRLLFYKNDSLYNGYQDIALFETTNIPTTLEAIIPFVLEKGDTASMKLYSLSSSVFEYFRIYSNITNVILSNSTVPPFNPPSNISGGALGYFQVSSVF